MTLLEKDKEILPTLKLSASSGLVRSLTGAFESLPTPEANMTAADLLYGCSQGSTEAAETLDTMALNRKQEFIDTLKNLVQGRDMNVVAAGYLIVGDKKANLDPSGYEVLVKAALLADRQNRPISTMDLLLADVKRKSSVLREAFQAIGQDANVTALLIERYAEQKRFKEQGVQTVFLQQFMPEATSASEPTQVVDTPRLTKDANRISYVLNLSESARQEGVDINIKPSRQLIELISAIDSYQLTVIVADYQQEADRLVQELAVLLSQDTESTFNASAVFGIDQVSLVSNPATAIAQALKAAKGNVLYLPQIDLYLGDINTALSTMLRRSIAAKDIRLVTTMSARGWRRVSEVRDFSSAYTIVLESPSVTQATEILQARRPRIEKELSTPKIALKISDSALSTTAKLASRYAPGQELALIRQAATLTKINLSSLTKLYDSRVKADGTVDEDDVVLALFYLKGIVVKPDDPEKYIHMEETLRSSVVGQDEAIAAVSKAIRRAMVGLKDPNRPIGSFLFLGPSGVGKTELARALASFLFDSPEAMLRLDMSEYHDRHTVARLIGAPPGYVGYEEGGQLSEYLKKRPYSVVLSDEIEKAHPDIANIWLQVLDAGRLTDSKGQIVDFRNTILIFTSNIGTEYYRQEGKVGREVVLALVRETLKDTLRPELLNRFDAVVIFKSLSLDNVRRIVDLRLRDLNNQLSAEKNITVQLTNEAREQIAQLGYSPEYGAREIKRVINSRIADALTEPLLRGEYTSGDTIEVTIKDSEFIFTKKK